MLLVEAVTLGGNARRLAASDITQAGSIVAFENVRLRQKPADDSPLAAGSALGRVFFADKVVGDWVHVEEGWLRRHELVTNDDDIVGYFRDALKIRKTPFLYTGMGLALFLEAQVEPALQNFSEALRLDPDYAPAYYGRAVTLWMMRRYDEEISSLTEYIRREPGDLIAIVRRGGGYEDTGQIERALADYRRAVELSPAILKRYDGAALEWLTSACECTAQIEYGRRNWTAAIRALDNALRVSPSEPRLYTWRGNALRANRDYQRALADYDVAIKLASSERREERRAGKLRDCAGGASKGGGCQMAGARLERIRCLIDLGERDAAAQECNRLIKTAPDLAEGFVARAGVRCSLKAFDDAISDCEAALAIDRKNVDAIVNRSVAWFGKREYERCILDCNEVIQIQPDSVVAYMNRSSALLKKGEVKRAIHDAQHALELSPRDTSAFQILATAYLLEGNVVDGLAVAAKGLEIAPFDAELHLKKGVALHLQGDFAGACDEFEHAARHAPGDPGPLAALAWLEATCRIAICRDGRRAIELATVACRLSDWKHPRHLAVLAAAYAEAGMFSAAIERAVQAASLAGDDPKLEQKIRKLLAAFRADRPYRSNVPWLPAVPGRRFEPGKVRVLKTAFRE